MHTQLPILLKYSSIFFLRGSRTNVNWPRKLAHLVINGVAPYLHELLKPIDGLNVICFDKADADIYWPGSAILILGWCGLSISSMGPFKQGHYHKAGNWNVEPQLKSFCKLFKISSIIYRINRFYSIFEKALVS